METSLGKRITTHRKGLGLTQDQLADKLGITAQAVSKWENDLSCPDITMLPKLADIFGITIDQLLGREQPLPAIEAGVVEDKPMQDSCFTYDSDTGKMDMHWDGIKLEGISLACWVLLTGVLYLLAQFLPVEISFWNILWPSFLFVLGIFGIYPKFSVFRVSCGLFGGYILLCKFHIIQVTYDNAVLVAVIILLFGLSLLADALRKNSKRRHHRIYTDRNGKIHRGELVHSYTVDCDRFSYDASFGSSVQLITLESLRDGHISTSFGEYTVDLRGVAAVDSHCTISTDCAFGELTILVPQHYTVIPDSTTAFANVEILGQPTAVSRGTIHLVADVSFGSICVKYI